MFRQTWDVKWAAGCVPGLFPARLLRRGGGNQAGNIVLKDSKIEGLEHEGVKAKLARFLGHFVVHLTGDENVLGRMEPLAKMLKEFDPIFAGEFIVEDEDVD